MKKILLLFLVIRSLSVFAQNASLLEQGLFDLPDVSFKKIDTHVELKIVF